MRQTRNALGIAMALTLLALAGTGAAWGLEFTITTADSDLVFSKVAGYDLVEVVGDKCSLEGDPGTPWLPVCNLHILIPPGSKASKVMAVVEDEAVQQGRYDIYPAQPAVPVSSAGPQAFVQPDAAVYASASPLRSVVAELVDTVVMRGYRVAVVRVYPVDYTPAKGRLVLRTRILLRLEMETQASVLSSFAVEKVAYKSVEPSFERLVAHDVINPKALASYASKAALPLSPTDPNDVEYLLIGDSSTFDEFQPLLDWKTKKGVPAEAVDVSWIYANYTGADNQERIKACIKDYVETRGTVWVALAGDNTIVPDRNTYGSVNGGDTTDSTLPTDLYYAGLDDMDWNDDGDGLAAEVNDDTIDMAPDVYVGRLPIRTEAQATAIVNKTLEYEKNQPASGFSEKMVLSGDQLWSAGDAEGKSEVMYTGWIDPHWDPVRDRFYDTNTDFAGGASYDVNVVHIDEVLVGGYNLFHMATHGGSTVWGMETGGNYSSTNALNVANTGKYTNIVTIACTTNAFDLADPCLSEGFIRNPNGGAVSYSGSSRYGWGYSGTTSHGSSFRYNRMFYEFLFTGDPAGHPQQVGAVHTRMKEYWIGSCSYYGSMRWCQFTVNLMGDPELTLYTCDPLTLYPSWQDTIPLGAQTYSVEAGIADALVCLWKGTEVYAYGHADGTGHFEAVIAPISTGTMDVTITAPNHYPHESTVTVAGSSAGIVFIVEPMCTYGHTLHVGVIDTDLAGNGTQNVMIVTTSGDSETLALAETGPATGVFEGTIVTAAHPIATEDAVLQIAHAETVTATYDDLHDGTGPATVTDTALTDCQGPAISNVQIADVLRHTATVSFDADDESIGQVRCGETAGGPYPIVMDHLAWGTAHSLDISGLEADRTYFVEVAAYDRIGNEVVDDNGGACYSFTTLALAVPPLCDDFDAGNLDYWNLNYGGSGDVPHVAIDSSLQGGLLPCSGANVAYLGDLTNTDFAESTMDLELDMSGFVEATLTFSWATYSLYGLEQVRVDIYDGTWHADVNAWAYQGAEWEARTLDLSAYNLIYGFVVRFRSYMDNVESGDAAYVDDVCVTGVPVSGLSIAPLKAECYDAAGPQGGPFVPPSKTYSLTNTGAVPIAWTASKTAAWLDDPAPAGGTINPSDPPVDVVVSIGLGADALADGTYTDVVTFQNVTEAVDQHRDVSLEVRPLEAFEWGTIVSPQIKNAPFGATVRAVDALGATVRAFTGTVDIEGLIGVGDITIGIGEWPWYGQPMATWSPQSRTQVIYLAGEVGGGGLITSIALDIGRAPEEVLTNWTIRMRHTALDEYTEPVWEGPAGWTVVYQNDETVSSTGWVTFDLSPGFDYNGTDNLMVDFSFNNPPETWGMGAEITWSTVGTQRAMCGDFDGTGNDPLDWTGTEAWWWTSMDVPDVRIEAGTPVPIAPIESGSFVDGEWSGPVTVLDTATGMHLKADDASGHKGNSVVFDVLPSGPEVVNVTTSHADGAFTVSEAIIVEVEFFEAVSVTGTPSLELDTGTVDWSGGDGTTTLTFTYTVGEGDTSPDLDCTGTAALQLNGGTIRDTATDTKDADLELPAPGTPGSLGANKDIVIDTEDPSVTAGALLTYDTSPPLTGTMGDNVEVASVAVTVDGNTYPATLDLPGGTWSLPGGTIAPPLGENVYTINAEAADTAGNTGTGTGALTVDLTNPMVAVDVLLTGDSTPTLTGTMSASVLPATVDVVVNGETCPAAVTPPTWEASVTLPLPHGVYDVMATVQDGLGRLGYDNDPEEELTVDLEAPTAEFTQACPNPTALNALQFDVQFSEEVGASFEATDVTLEGSLAAVAAVPPLVTGTDPIYTVTVTLTDADADGTIGISVAGAGSVTDLAGNPYGGGAAESYAIHNWFGFTVQPVDARLYISDSHQLTVNANCGSSPPLYEWWFDDGSKAAAQIGDNADTLELAPITAETGGGYWCDVTYDGVTYSANTATLQVAEHVAITDEPEGGEKTVDEPHTFSVTAAGGYPPLTYVWKQDGATKASGSEYAITGLQLSDSGTYTVEVSDDNGDVRIGGPAALTVTSGVPVAGLAGLGALIGVCVLGGAVALRRRNLTR